MREMSAVNQALVIGVDTYLSKDLEQLPPCKKDAQDVASLLLDLDYEVVGNGPFIGSELHNEYGWVAIRDAIFDFFGDAKPSQKLLFYFSGHGVLGDNEVFLATSQVDPRKPGKKGVALSELTKCMASSKSKRIVGIIDACYSGGANLPSGLPTKSAKDSAGRALAAYDRIWKKTPKAKGIFLLLSSQAYEASYATENSNSLYTKHLLEGLRGVRPSMIDGQILQSSGSIEFNGDVTPRSLHDYIYYKVASEAKQVPELKSDQSSSFTIVSYPDLAFQNPALIPKLKAVDLSKYVTIHDQGSEATSVAMAAVIAMETSLALQGKPQPLSVRYIYEKAKMHDETAPEEEATFTTTVAYVIQQFGAPQESTWPYEPYVRTLPSGTDWKKLDSEASENRARVYLLTSFEDIPVHLNQGRPIVAGINVYRSFIYAERGQIPLPDVSGHEDYIGGHSIVIIGYDPKTSSIRFANPWGSKWGDNGFGSMTEDVARACLAIDEMFAVEMLT
jgi:hypothetical protein